MKKFIAILFAGLLTVACDSNDTANVSSITDYPLLTLKGSSPVFVTVGTTYNDQGAVATESGKTIPFVTSATGNYRGGTSIDTSVPDEYSQTYTATNTDGFKASAVRTVYVYKNSDLVTGIEGLYTSTVVRNGTSGAAYTDMKYIHIWKKANGTYEMSDGIGGYYNYGRGYGIGYAARPVIITANNIATNSFTIPNFTVGGFGGVCTMTQFTVNPVNKTITFTTTWDAGYTFVVTLKQVQP
ncbi:MULTISPECIES: BT_2262 family domain-containing protein [unclassified Flavobacterium]|uniref:BT_2262 family domain-containing protein n=1 Tax=unclassified Flavobacterium TaxID=196869 RepID=UPI003F9076C3